MQMMCKNTGGFVNGRRIFKMDLKCVFSSQPGLETIRKKTGGFVHERTILKSIL